LLPFEVSCRVVSHSLLSLSLSSLLFSQTRAFHLLPPQKKEKKREHGEKKISNFQPQQQIPSQPAKATPTTTPQKKKKKKNKTNLQLKSTKKI